MKNGIIYLSVSLWNDVMTMEMSCVKMVETNRSDLIASNEEVVCPIFRKWNKSLNLLYCNQTRYGNLAGAQS